MIFHRPFFKLTCLLLLSVWMTPANSVAYCALRDPVTKIYALFPDASSYKSIVHKIDLATKEQVSAKASFSLHQDELGQHTLYIAMKDELPLGIIHSRSEVGLWGLIEIVWAFDFDLNVVDFTFQRCRESACKQIAALPFRHLLKGKSSSELTAMLKSSSTVYPENIAGNKDAEALANTIIQSAIKTALVTEISWRDDLEAFSTKYTQ